MCLTKAEIKRAISENHYKDVKKELDKSSKLEHVKGEDFSKVQEYFSDKSVENCRMSFRVRCHMVQEIPGGDTQRIGPSGYS